MELTSIQTSQTIYSRTNRCYRSAATVEIPTAAVLPVECCRQPGEENSVSFRHPSAMNWRHWSTGCDQLGVLDLVGVLFP